MSTVDLGSTQPFAVDLFCGAVGLSYGMKQAGIEGASRRRSAKTTTRGEASRPAPDDSPRRAWWSWPSGADWHPQCRPASYHMKVQQHHRTNRPQKVG